MQERKLPQIKFLNKKKPKSSRLLGTNPRAMGTNPRAKGTNPRNSKEYE